MFLLYEFFIEYFSTEHTLPFAFTKVRILLSVSKLTTAQRCEKAAKKDIRILCYESYLNTEYLPSRHTDQKCTYKRRS